MSALEDILKKRKKLEEEKATGKKQKTALEDVLERREQIRTTGKLDLPESGPISPIKTTTKKKEEENGFWSGLSYLGKELGTEAFGGLSKIPYALTSEVGANLKKGEGESVGKMAVDTFKAITSLTKPSMTAHILGENLSESIRKQAKTDKSTGKKILGTAFDLATADNPIDKTIQTIGSVLPEGSGDTVNKIGEKILSPYNKMRDKLNEEKTEQSGLVQLGGSTIGVIGNMIPSIAATVLSKNPNVGLTMIGASAKGGATNEALKGGADLETATKY